MFQVDWFRFKLIYFLTTVGKQIKKKTGPLNYVKGLIKEKIIK